MFFNVILLFVFFFSFSEKFFLGKFYFENLVSLFLIFFKCLKFFCKLFFYFKELYCCLIFLRVFFGFMGVVGLWSKLNIFKLVLIELIELFFDLGRLFGFNLNFKFKLIDELLDDNDLWLLWNFFLYWIKKDMSIYRNWKIFC